LCLVVVIVVCRKAYRMILFEVCMSLQPGRRQGVAGPLQFYFFSWLRPCFQRKLCFSPDRNSSLCKKEVVRVKWLSKGNVFFLQRLCYQSWCCHDFKFSMLLSLDDEAIDCVVMDSWLISFELLFFTQWSYDCCLVNQYYGRHDRNLPPTRTNTRELIREWAISWRSIPLDFIFVSSLQLAICWELFFLKGFGHYSFSLAASN
jgi:hypothetical protein